MGFEPTLSDVTGRRFKPLSYRAIWYRIRELNPSLQIESLTTYTDCLMRHERDFDIPDSQLGLDVRHYMFGPPGGSMPYLPLCHEFLFVDPAGSIGGFRSRGSFSLETTSNSDDRHVILIRSQPLRILRAALAGAASGLASKCSRCLGICSLLSGNARGGIEPRIRSHSSPIPFSR